MSFVFGRKANVQLGAFAAVGAVLEIDVMARSDRGARQVDVASDDAPVVFGAGGASFAPNLDGAGQCAADEATDVASQDVEGPIEFQHGPLGRAQEDGLTITHLPVQP